MAGLLPPVIAELRADISEFQASMAEAKGEMDGVAESANTSSSKMNSIGKGLLLGVAGAAVAVGVASVDMASKYQSATDRLAGSADISIAKATAIGSAFLDTGGKTIYSAQQMMNAYQPVAAQLGLVQGHALDAAQATKVMSAASDLAEASNTDLGSATKDLATVMQAYGIKVSGAANASNVLFETSNLTGQSVDKVTQAFQRLHSQLGSVTPSLGDVGGLLADLSAHGETGRQSISAVNTALTSLLKTADASAAAQQNANAAYNQLPPTLKALADGYKSGAIGTEAMTTAEEGLSSSQAALLSNFTSNYDKVTSSDAAYKNLGLSVTDAKGNFVGMSSVITQLDSKMQGMSQAQQLAYLQTVFGTSANRKLLDVIEAGPVAYEHYVDAVTKKNAAQEAAEKQDQSIGKQLEMIGTALEDEGVKIGLVLIPKLEDLMHAAEDTGQWLSQNKDVLYALGAAAALVGGTLIGGYLVNSIRNLSSTLVSNWSSVVGFGEKLLGIGTADAEVEAANDELALNTTTTAERLEAAAASIAASMEEMVAAFASGAGEIDGALASIDESIAATEAEMESMGGVGMESTASGLLVPAGALGTTAVGGEAAAAAGAAGAAGGSEGAAVGAGEGEAEGVAAGAGAGALGGGSILSTISAAALPFIIANPESIVVPLGDALDKAVNKTPLSNTGFSTEQQAVDNNAPLLAIQDTISAVEKHTMTSAQGIAQLNQEASYRKSQGSGAQGNLQQVATALQQAVAALKQNAPQTYKQPAAVDTTANQRTSLLGQINQSQAKDKSLSAEQLVLAGLRTNVQQQTAQYGAGSKQANAALTALQSTDAKFFPGLSKDTSVAKVNQGITQQYGSLKQLVSKQDTLATEKGLGNITQATQSLKADQALLSKEETAGATKDAINDTKSEIKVLQSHIDDLKSVNQKITKTEDTLNEMNSLKSSLETVKNTEDTMRTQISSDLHTSTSSAQQGADAIKSAITSGIKITDMPQRNATVSGSMSMSVR